MITTHMASNEIYDAKKFIKKILIFFSPLIVIFLVNYIVDPFNLNRMVSLPFDKQEIACHFNERLWKLTNFLNHPVENIILGDSRASRLSEKTVEKLMNKPFTNLSLSGATLVEIIDTFWFASEHIKLQEVILCINFDRFNDWQKANGVTQAVNSINNPLMNYFQPQTCKAAGLLFLQKVTIKKVISQQPPVSRDAFWQFQIDEVDMGYKRFVFPSYASSQLSSIANYCKKHAISLSFVIFPTHYDLQKRIDHANLRQHEGAFKEFLTSLAPVHDFDIANDFTLNRDNFDDPKHVSFTAMDKLITSCWSSNITNAKKDQTDD